MKKLLFVFGTRPEAIKMAPVINQFKGDQTNFKTYVAVTAQHREMLDQVLDFFNVETDYDLDLMRPGQNLYSLTAIIIESLSPILEEFYELFVSVRLMVLQAANGARLSIFPSAIVRVLLAPERFLQTTHRLALLTFHATSLPPRNTHLNRPVAHLRSTSA